ncbi:GDSL-type esterase/lipase family protein [Spirochaeta lutea]|uniref:SGNH hydrolase-type esterase domain-containing protein n=1 Tax=Spirochaeta lutea TaxID=1480694 RepID=A0A098QU11_9SPIO|nr:hypothetical protein DC28_15435 [Spirochaeta lutea]
MFLLIGTNDLTGGVPEEQIVSNIIAIVERIRTESPQTEIYVQSVLPRSEDYTAQVESLNSAIQDAVVGQAMWIDLYLLFLDEEGTSIDDALSTDDYIRKGRNGLRKSFSVAQVPYTKKIAATSKYENEHHKAEQPMYLPELYRP